MLIPVDYLLEADKVLKHAEGRLPYPENHPLSLERIIRENNDIGEEEDIYKFLIEYRI